MHEYLKPDKKKFTLLHEQRMQPTIIEYRAILTLLEAALFNWEFKIYSGTHDPLKCICIKRSYLHQKVETSLNECPN